MLGTQLRLGLVDLCAGGNAAGCCVQLAGNADTPHSIRSEQVVVEPQIRQHSRVVEEG